MKILLPVQILLLLISIDVLSQQISERKLMDVAEGSNADVYNFKTDKASGNHCYVVWENDRMQGYIISNGRNSEKFNYIAPEYIRFLSNGKYAAAGDTYGDSIKPGYSTLIIEGKSVLKAELIDWLSGYISESDEIVFIMKENEKFSLGIYSETGGLKKQGSYDELKAAMIIDPNSEAEGEYYLGDENYFHDKSGRRVFIGLRDGRAYLITVFDETVTPFSDIDQSSLCYDLNGNLCYIAKENGGLYTSGRGYFLVRNSEKILKRDYIYPPVYVDKRNNLHCMGADSTGEYKYEFYIVSAGNSTEGRGKDGRKFDSGIQNIKVNDDGILSYIGASILKGNEDGDYNSESFLVTDSDMLRLGYNVRPPVAGAGDEFLFAAQSDPKVIRPDLFRRKGNAIEKVNQKSYDEIYGYGYTNRGEIYYMGMLNTSNSGAYNPNVDLVIDNKLIGTYSYVVYQSIGDSVYPITYSADGKFAFVADEQLEDSSFASFIFVNGSKLPLPENTLNKTDRLFGVFNMMYTKSGKLFCIATTKRGAEYYDDEREIIVDNESLGKVYNSFSPIEYNKDTDTVNFIAARGRSVYEVKVKF